MDKAEHEPGFNPLAAAKALREAGFENRQAEAVASVVSDGRRGLATKADLDAGLDNLERRLLLAMKAGNAELKADLLKWFIGGMIALAGVVVAAAGIVVAIVL